MISLTVCNSKDSHSDHIRRTCTHSSKHPFRVYFITIFMKMLFSNFIDVCIENYFQIFWYVSCIFRFLATPSRMFRRTRTDCGITWGAHLSTSSTTSPSSQHLSACPSISFWWSNGSWTEDVEFAWIFLQTSVNRWTTF